MGQCTSNKAKAGKLSVKKTLLHKKIGKKMEKQHKHFKDPKEDYHKGRQMAGNKETNKILDVDKKAPQKYTKGVAMSFGFKRRPTPMTTNSGSAAWDSGPIRSDSNGNKNEITGPRQTSLQDKSMLHKMPLHPPSQKTTHNISTRPISRTSFPQTPTDHQRTNKVGDIKLSPQPLQFGAQPIKPSSRRTSPNADPNRTFTRNVTIVTRTEVIDRADVTRDRNENRDELGGAQALQPGKFTFQTTRLPQPEPIQLIETKTAKTIANNSRRSARLWRQYEEASVKIGTSRDDSGFGSHASEGNGENEHLLPSYMACLDRNSEQDSLRERLQGCRKLDLLENSDSFSDACTPPPLPDLPPAFNLAKHVDTNKETEFKNENSKKTFLKSSANPSNFLKTRRLLDRGSPQSCSDQEWINGGEAMADDVSLTLTLSPYKPRKVEEQVPTKKSTSSKAGAVTEAILQTVLQPSVCLEMIDSLKESMNLTLSDDDPNFTAVITNNHTAALLDDEILSPVESLLSSSETDDLVKRKSIRSCSNSKDVNEKLTPCSPDTPSNATYSLSLSDDKEDFLIDDEIADQPELVFEKGNNSDLSIGRQFLLDTSVEADSKVQRRTSYNSDYSPLPLRKRGEYLKSTNQGSFDSLSPCDSIGSEDLMMDFDLCSQTNDVDVWDRQNESFPSLENTSKPKFKTDDSRFNNKNFFKSLTPKRSLTNARNANNSPNSLRSRPSRRSSPDCRSPKRNPFGFQSMTYDPSSESLTLTRTNHSAVQQDIIGIKTMLLTLKRVLNESESHNSFKDYTEDVSDNGRNNNNNNNNNNINTSEFTLELADLRRQVIFLQGQLEDKENAVSNLQKQVDGLAIQNTRNYLDDAPILTVNTQDKCNAATQTERTRPLSSGVFSLTSTPIEGTNPILRSFVK